MTLVTGTVQDLGYDGMEGTLWARPARFRSDGQVVYAPERKPYRVVDGVVSADLAPGPAVLELQVGSHARGTFEVVIPEEDTTLADLLDTVFPWEPAQVSLFVAEREAAELAKTEAEAAAGQATTAAQQTGQDRSHVDQVRTELDEAFDESTAGNVLPPRLTETALNATYATKGELPEGVVTATEPTRFVRVPEGQPRPALLADGDLVVWYSEPGAHYFADFADGTVGAVPAGFTNRWDAGSLWSVVEDATATGGKALECRGPAGRNFLTLDAVDGDRDRADSEVLMRVKATSGQLTFFAGIRGSGTGGNETAYRIGYHYSQREVGVYVDGEYETIRSGGGGTTVDQWHYIRARVTGDVTRLKYWADGTTEPETWLSTTFPSIADPGWVGIITSTGYRHLVDWIAVATGGRTAVAP